MFCGECGEPCEPAYVDDSFDAADAAWRSNCCEAELFKDAGLKVVVWPSDIEWHFI